MIRIRSKPSKPTLATLIGALAILAAFLPFNRRESQTLDRIREQFLAAEQPLRQYDNVPAEPLAAAIPAFEAIDATGAPAPVRQALHAFIASMHECVRLMRQGDSIEARQASREVEAARQRFVAKLNEARGAPF